MITSHRQPRSYSELALLVVIVTVILGILAGLFVLGLIGLDNQGNVHVFEWGYCLLERMGCVVR